MVSIERFSPIEERKRSQGLGCGGCGLGVGVTLQAVGGHGNAV